MYKIIPLITLTLLTLSVHGQMLYQEITNKSIAIGTYGRIGIDWNFENGGSLGRKLNLNNMGSIGGRLEEQDYVEIANAFRFKPKENDSTIIHVQSRLSVFSKSLSVFANSNSSSLGGLSFALPELFVLARNIKGLPLNIWIGARLYRGEDIQIADHFYFNDHSGQGFGIEYKKSRYMMNLVSSNDTTSTLPPSFFLNIVSGIPSLALRGRFVHSLEHDFKIKDNHTLTGLLELQHLEAANPQEIENLPDSLQNILNYPSDYGWVIGGRYAIQHKKLKNNSYTNISIRYGNRIANGGDGGLSRTYLTFGAPNLNNGKFSKAYSWALVGHTVLQLAPRLSVGGYVTYTKSRGAAESDNIASTYFGREVFNRKEDLTIGARTTHYLSDLFHLFWEVHYSQRKDGTQNPASMFKVSLSPTIVPTQEISHFARPHLRFVMSLARYNQQARETLYSPFLEFAGAKKWGHYFGFKAEWWLWN